MTSIAKLEPYIRNMGFDLYEFEKFFIDGLNYDSEAEERALKQLAGNLMRSIIAINETMTDEEFLTGDDERLEELIALSFGQSRDDRDNRRSPESKAIYAAEMAGRM